MSNPHTPTPKPSESIEAQTLKDILTNYEFQVIAMSDDDTGTEQKAEATAAIKAWAKEQVNDDWKSIYSKADTPEQAVNQARANYKQQLNDKIDAA